MNEQGVSGSRMCKVHICKLFTLAKDSRSGQNGAKRIWSCRGFVFECLSGLRRRRLGLKTATNLWVESALLPQISALCYHFNFVCNLLKLNVRSKCLKYSFSCKMSKKSVQTQNWFCNTNQRPLDKNLSGGETPSSSLCIACGAVAWSRHLPTGHIRTREWEAKLRLKMNKVRYHYWPTLRHIPQQLCPTIAISC